MVEEKRRGRPPTFAPGEKSRMFGVHINMAPEIWDAVKKYAGETGEFSLSSVARTLLRERLKQLGYLNNKPTIQNMTVAEGRDRLPA